MAPAWQSATLSSDQDESRSRGLGGVHRGLYFVSRRSVHGSEQTNLVLANGLLSDVNHVHQLAVRHVVLPSSALPSRADR